MQTLTYNRVDETVYYEKLSNGLDVYLLPKPGFQKTYATFTTKYGSVDNHFRPPGGEPKRVPDGIAHFLEHKMFEEPTGDVFATFAQNGASSNAFTSFDRTAYLFSATTNIDKNVLTLLDFVQNPYFTDQNVEKEKGIIGQEIKMYQDNPDWRVYFGLIEAMYQKHPIHIDIAGTVESISQISKETLYDCYHTFYHPSNMLLFVVGGFDAPSLMQLIKENQSAKSFGESGAIERIFEPEPETVRTPQIVIKLPVSQPKCLFGFKEEDIGLQGAELLRYELVTKLGLDILLNPSSDLYQKLYDENIISDSFGHEFNCASDYAFSIIGGDTQDPDLLLKRVREELDQALANGVKEIDFERTRKKRMGGFLRMLNSPEAIANEFTKFRFKDTDLFDMLSVYESITLDEVNGRLRSHIQWPQLAVSIVRTGDQA